MSGYSIRRSKAAEFGRWKVHDTGYPSNVRGTFVTRWGATRTARRWAKEDKRARRSIPV